MPSATMCRSPSRMSHSGRSRCSTRPSGCSPAPPGSAGSGRFQLEAAIQSAHAQRAATGTTDWQAIALLYEGLVRMAPTIGALVGRAAAVAEARGAEAGLDAARRIAGRTGRHLSALLGAECASARPPAALATKRTKLTSARSACAPTTPCAPS